MITILSWNVNGIRAVIKAGFLEWLQKARPDVLCVQESRAHPTDIRDEERAPKGYASFWNPAEKKGYSGTAVYVRMPLEPLSVSNLGVERFDEEGRLQVVEFKDFTILNGYWPNSQPERARLEYKLDFVKTVTKHANKLVKAGHNVILCGDFNIAHQPIDLARPKENEKSPGYYIEEREAMTHFLKAGYVDTFRHMHPDKVEYSWWSLRSGARARNIGWRIDYHCVNRDFLPRIRKAFILGEVTGSDHCPVGIEVA